MNSFKIIKGHNLKLSGNPSKKIFDVVEPTSIVFHPSSIKNIKTKLLIKEGGKSGLWKNPDGLPDFLNDIF